MKEKINLLIEILSKNNIIESKNGITFEILYIICEREIKGLGKYENDINYEGKIRQILQYLYTKRKDNKSALNPLSILEKSKNKNNKKIIFLKKRLYPNSQI